MNSGRGTNDELLAYMKTRVVRNRAKKLERKTLAKLDRSERFSFGEIADGFDLPIDVIVGGFVHAMAGGGVPFSPGGPIH